MQGDIRRIEAAFARLIEDGAEAGRIAALAVATWGAVDAALSPILGQRGVVALYQRSLHLARHERPWLGVAYDGALQPGDFGALQAVLSARSDPDAAAAHMAVLRTFADILIRLIGAELAERLLRPVLGDPSTGAAAQDDLK